jgi:hypothetical protein
MVAGFKLTDVKILPQYTEVENGVGKEMIYLLCAIMKTCYLTGINSEWHNL